MLIPRKPETAIVYGMLPGNLKSSGEIKHPSDKLAGLV